MDRRCALVRRKHGHQYPHHGPRRVELSALFALSRGELPEKILVDLAQHVLCLVLRGKANLGNKVDQLPQPRRLNLRLANRLSSMFLSEGFTSSMATSASSSRRPISGCFGLIAQCLPPRHLRNPEDVWQKNSSPGPPAPEPAPLGRPRKTAPTPGPPAAWPPLAAAHRTHRRRT